jgi:hypothetical protein
MNLPGEEDFVARREQLAAQIDRQRSQLAAAYNDLEKPIRYAEYGMRGFGFLRQNPWVIAAVPAVFSLISSAIGFKKQKKASPSSEQYSKPKGGLNRARQVIASGVNNGWQLYQLYRRVRSFLP